MKWLCATCDASDTGKRPSVCPSCDSPRIVLDLRGRVLGERYRLERLIGIGSQDSSVWKSLQISVERDVAVKVMPGGRDLARERFARGAKLASMLSHPHITVTHDYGETKDGYVYLVMELLQGRSLRAELANTPSIPAERALHIVNQVLGALEAAHGEQIVHRDLKPDNLFLAASLGDPDYVKVLDFGIAKFFEEERSGEGMDTTIEGQITRGWQLCGTPLYMAPEQINGDPVDARTDIYALGIVLYQLLVGHPPFRAKTQAAVLSQHLRDLPELIASARPDIRAPDSLDRLVMRAMAKAPMDRFSSAREMRHVVQNVQKQMGFRVDTTAEMDDFRRDTTPTVRRGAGASITVSTHMEKPEIPQGSRWWTLGLLALLAVFGYWAAIGGEARDSGLGENITVDVPWESGGVTGRAKGRLKLPDRRGDAISAAMVSLRTTPVGATVLQGGTKLGETPITLTLRADQMHQLDLVLDGYQTHTATVDPKLAGPRGVLDLRITLEPMDRAQHAPPPIERRRRSRGPRRRAPPATVRPGPTSAPVIDPRPVRRAPRIERLDAPKRTGAPGPGARKPKIKLLE